MTDEESAALNLDSVFGQNGCDKKQKSLASEKFICWWQTWDFNTDGIAFDISATCGKNEKETSDQEKMRFSVWRLWWELQC